MTGFFAPLQPGTYDVGVIDSLMALSSVLRGHRDREVRSGTLQGPVARRDQGVARAGFAKTQRRSFDLGWPCALLPAALEAMVAWGITYKSIWSGASSRATASRAWAADFLGAHHDTSRC